MEDLLAEHQFKVLQKEEIQRITIRRNHITKDALQALKQGFQFNQKLNVIFMGEPAVDAGGPCREFFRLLIGELTSNNSLFQGKENARMPFHNIGELQKNTYFHVGQIFALSLVNGGPGPQCLSNSVVDYLFYGLHKIRGVVEDLPNEEIKKKIQKVTLCFSYLSYS